MGSFIPDNENVEIEIPFFSDVMGRADEGWTGHTTSKSAEKLKGEISAALGRLGAIVTSFQSGRVDAGKENERMAVRIHYTVASEEGQLFPGQIDIAALPVDHERCQNEASYDNKCNKSLRMALVMALRAFEGAWNMKVLSPGYSPLVPWMLAPNSDKTISQTFNEAMGGGDYANMLPETIIDGDFKEVK